MIKIVVRDWDNYYNCLVRYSETFNLKIEDRSELNRGPPCLWS